MRSDVRDAPFISGSGWVSVSSPCLSSTAALFGVPNRIPIDEEETLAPVSAYGESKLMAERGLDWADRIHGLRSASLRYFNAAGADPGGRLGEDHDPETHLIPCPVIHRGSVAPPKGR